MLKVLVAHLRRGTFIKAVLGKFKTGHHVWMVKWHGTSNPEAGLGFLVGHANATFKAANQDSDWVLTIGNLTGFHQRLNEQLKTRHIRYRSMDAAKLADLSETECESLVAIYCAYTETRDIAKAASAVNNHSRLAEVPFEYVSGLDKSAREFNDLDEYPDTRFVSPVLLDTPDPFEIYAESLKIFEQKCGLRDFLDLYQVIKTVVTNNVEGAFAEFGSYKGHSGWLIARTLEALGSDRSLYMFDAFDSFPEESLGIDKFWSKTHHVDFDEVANKLKQFQNVTLVRGDFTKTLSESKIGPICMAHVDCDSYRATRFLFEQLLDGRLTEKGAIVCEDYGHPALLGSRLAVHDVTDGRKDSIRFFSQFSGLYILFKT